MNGLLSGSVSSVVVAIGIKYRRTSPEESPEPVWDMVDKYVGEFKEKSGHVNCGDLTGLDLKTKEGMKEYYIRVHDYACVDRPRFAIEKAVKLLE